MPDLSKKWSDTTLRSLRNAAAPKSGRDQYTDPGQPGLILRHSGKGHLSFYARYSVRGLGQTMMPLGEYPDLKLEEARDLVREAQRKGRASIDISQERKREAKERLSEEECTFKTLFGGDEIEVERKIRDEKGKVVKGKLRTVSILQPDVSKWKNTFWKSKAGDVRRLRSIRELRNLFRNNFLNSPWGEWAMAHVEPADLFDWVDWATAKAGPTGVRKTTGVLRDMYLWATRKRYFRGIPPTAKDVFKLKTKKGVRTRILDVNEIRNVYNAALTMGYPRGDFYYFMLLTGQRLTQCLWARWDDIDISEALWKVRDEDTKSGEEKLVPLSKQVIDLLSKIEPKIDYVFAKPDGKEPFVTHKVKHVELYELTGREKEGWIPHDFRRSQRTRLAQSPNVKGFVADMLAGREGSEKAGVSGVYNQYDYLSEMRNAAQIWADWLEVAVKNNKTIVPLEAKR
jgi:integrase